MGIVVVIIALIVLAALGLFVIPRFMMKRAISQVIRIFRERRATEPKMARTAEELDIKSRGLLEGMFRGRDYKPYALQALMRQGIIMQTEDGRLYLSEDRVAASGLGK